MLLSPCAIKRRTKQRGSVIVIMSNNCSPCPQCNELLIAPNQSEYVSDHDIRHFWCCEYCGHRVEMVVNLRITAALKLSKRVTTPPVFLVA